MSGNLLGNICSQVLRECHGYIDGGLPLQQHLFSVYRLEQAMWVWEEPYKSSGHCMVERKAGDVYAVD